MPSYRVRAVDTEQRRDEHAPLGEDHGWWLALCAFRGERATWGWSSWSAACALPWRLVCSGRLQQQPQRAHPSREFYSRALSNCTRLAGLSRRKIHDNERTPPTYSHDVSVRVQQPQRAGATGGEHLRPGRPRHRVNFTRAGTYKIHANTCMNSRLPNVHFVDFSANSCEGRGGNYSGAYCYPPLRHSQPSQQP